MEGFHADTSGFAGWASDFSASIVTVDHFASGSASAGVTGVVAVEGIAEEEKEEDGFASGKKAGSGNRCGHDPSSPRFFVQPEKHKDRPFILRKLAEKIRAYFDDPRLTIPSLDLANGKDRQQRSERREACLAVLGCMIHFLDLVTLRVGIPAQSGFAGLTVPYLAELSGLGVRRTERAIGDLAKAGLITVCPLCQRKDDLTYKGYAAIRTVSAAVFALFGLGRWLPHERGKAAARLKKKRLKQEAAELAKVKLALGGLANKTGQPGMPGLPNNQRGASAPNPPKADGPKGALEYLAGIKAMLNGKDPPL